MSNVGHVNEVLLQFLEAGKPGVFAIKGDWGAGKTYFWREMIRKARTHTKGRAYSYVSLFGVGSIPELRRAIFTKQEPLSSSGWKWLGKVAEGVRRIDLGPVTKGALKNTELWSEMIQDKFLKDFVVCIDDLERKEAQITPSALLGFVTSLRDERNCRVVLLYNESEAIKDESLKKSLAEYREKVFDREVAFEPTVEECFQIIFGNDPERYRLSVEIQPRSNPFLAKDARSLLEIFQSLKVANIRVLKKTKDALDYFEPNVQRQYPNVWLLFARQVVKLCCLHYLYGNKFPLEVLTKTSLLMDHLRKQSKDPEKRQEHELRRPIRDIGYDPVDTDLIISEFLRRGFVEWERHAELLAAQEKRLRLKDVNAMYSNVWGLLWENFGASQQEFTDALLAFIEKHFHEISLWELDEVSKISEEFGPSPKIGALLEQKITEFVRNFDGDSLSNVAYRPLSPATSQKINSLLSKKTVSKPIAEAIAMMTKPGSWHPNDIRYLSMYTVDDFYRWLETERSDGLLHRLKEFRSRFAKEPDGIPVVSRLDNALHRIAARSKIDEIRVYSNIGLERIGPAKVPEEQPPAFAE